jgi:hypothetical protein
MLPNVATAITEHDNLVSAELCIHPTTAQDLTPTARLWEIVAEDQQMVPARVSVGLLIS